MFKLQCQLHTRSPLTGVDTEVITERRRRRLSTSLSAISLTVPSFLNSPPSALNSLLLTLTCVPSRDCRSFSGAPVYTAGTTPSVLGSQDLLRVVDSEACKSAVSVPPKVANLKQRAQD